MFAKVIVDIAHAAVDRAFTYRVPDGLDIRPGHHVLVPFGQGSHVQEGFVLSLSEESGLEEGVAVKDVLSCVEPYTVLLPEQIALAEWMQEAYHCLLVDALRLMIPAQLRGSRIREKRERIVYLADPGVEFVSRSRIQNDVVELLQKTGLDRYAFGSVHSQFVMVSDVTTGETAVGEGETTTAPVTRQQDLIVFHVVNNADEPIQAILAGVYIDGELVESQGGTNADNSPLEKGELLSFFLDNEYTMDKLNDQSELKLEFSVETPEGMTYEIPGQMRIPLSSGMIHDIHITGNSRDGFKVSQ